MIFAYGNWKKFCKKLSDNGFKSITATDVYDTNKQYVVLKHDVETNVKKAYKIAKIESKYAHKGVYYVQAYLLNKQKNVDLLKKMQSLGHEISYHYDCLDASHGDYEKAVADYDKNVKKFEENGFQIKTVCQHGNPVIERRGGYSSNRDFFRNKNIAEKYQAHADIMVNFPEKAKTKYLYYSDAGRKFNLIYDPFFNDVTDSSDKNITYKN